MDQDELVCKLFSIGAVKFGRFTLKSGVQSPIYFDLRVIVSHPRILSAVSEVLWSAASKDAHQFSCVCGVPYTALPIATLVSVNHDIPMLMRRKEVKDYGTKKAIEGEVVVGSKCLVLEDVVTSGGSVVETANALREVGLEVSQAVVLLDREQGGRENLQAQGITLHSVLTLSQLLGYLSEAGKVSMETEQQVHSFIKSAGRIALPPAPTSTPHSLPQSFAARSTLTPHPLTRRILTLMEDKGTNLALSADVSSSQQLLKLAEDLGPYICILKTHADIVADFTLATAELLKELAQKHNFVIMEDRKFADIGNTCRLQYGMPSYHMSVGWAELVTCHALPGPGVIEGLRGQGCGCVVVVEMSSEGNLATAEYTKAAVSMAESHSDSVVGVVCRGQVSHTPSLLHMTPGVKIGGGGDKLGQQYLTPEQAVLERGTDIIIVGRGIIQAPDPVAAAQLYRSTAFAAYRQRLD